jgi:type IV secretion system protein TrbL
MNTGVIDRFTEVFTRYIDSGFGLLGGDVAFLASTLIAIDITLAGLFWAWGADEDVLAHLVKKTLYVGFFAFLIGNFNSLAKIVFNSFSGLGLKAAGSSLSADQFLQPGRLAQVGIDAGKPILDAASQLTGYVSFFANFIQIFVLLTAWLVVVVAFFILAIQLFVTLIEFKLTTLAGFILVPFGLFSKTAFLAERVLGNVVASGVKVLVLAVIVGIGTTLFGEFTQGFNGNQPSLEDALALVLAALSLLGLMPLCRSRRTSISTVFAFDTPSRATIRPGVRSMPSTMERKFTSSFPAALPKVRCRPCSSSERRARRRISSITACGPIT